MADGVLHGFVLLRGEFPQHPGRQIVVRVGLFPHPQLYPGKLLAAGAFDDTAHPVVSPVSAFAADAKLSRFQGNVVK